MVEKNKTYDDFLKSLRIALTNTSMYFKEHPLFVKSVDSLKKNINTLLLSIDPLRIGITPDSLLFGKDCLKEARLHEEVATFYHQRKVKVITFKKGLNNEELILFLVSVNLSPKEILLKGGLDSILKEARLKYITVEDLDYSQLLKDEGAEYSDIWLFLLRKSLKQGNSNKIDALTNDFKKMLKKLRIEDLVGNKGVKESMGQLFSYLKDKDAGKFSQCSKELTKSVLENGDQLDDGQVDKFKNLLKDMAAKDMSNVLLEQLQGGDKVDPLSLNLFSKLIGRDKHKGVAAFLTEKVQKEEQLKNDPKVISGIRELVSSPDFSSHETKIYYDNLSAILENITLGGGLRFNRGQVVENYRFILLNIFVLELSPERLESVTTVLLPEIDKALKANDLKYLESFKKALAKKEETVDFKSTFPGVNKEISAFAEKAIFNEDYSLDLGFLTDMVNSNSIEASFYLDKIFKERKISPAILKLFFKLFPDLLFFFCAELDKKTSDFRFVEEIMKNLTMTEPSLSLEVLKHIFSSANDFVKIKVLENMAELHLDGQGFLFSIIDEGGILQRKRVLSLLVRSPALRSKIAPMLLAIPNPFGLKGKIIEQNLNLVDEVPFPEAKPYLTALSKYRFFWNRKIRIKANEILKKNGI